MTTISDIRWKEDEDHGLFPPVDSRGGLLNYESEAKARRQGLLSTERYSPTVHDINWKEEVPEDDSWNITRGLKSGLWSTAAVVPAIGAMAAKTVEWEGGAKAMAGAAQNLMKRAEQYQPDTSFGELIEDPSLGGAVDWALYTIGNFAPSMAVGFGGAGIGAKLFLKNAIKQGIKRGLTKEVAAKAITDEIKKKIVLKGAQVGIVSSTGALESGHMFMGDVERHGIEDVSVGKAVALGGLAGLVELGIGGFGKGHMRLIEKYLGKVAKETAKKQPHLAIRMLDEIGRQTGGEAFQELTQEELAILHEAWTATPEEYAEHDHWSKENWLRRAESGLGGGLMGFGGGMITPTGRVSEPGFSAEPTTSPEEINKVKADIKSGLIAEGIKSGDLTLETMLPVIERVATQDSALAKQITDMFAVKEADLTENERRFEEDPLNAENNAEYLDKYIKRAALPEGVALTPEERIAERAKTFETRKPAEISAEIFEKEITEAERVKAKAEIEPDINKFLKRGYEPYHIPTAVEITEGKGIPTTPDQKRLLKGMTIEEAQESAKLWNEIWSVTTKQAEKEARIVEALTLIRERPDLFNTEMFAPEIEEYLALPPGQGFELKPTTKLKKPPISKPYEADVTYKPIVSKSGKPFKSMARANRVLKNKGLSPTEYTIIEHEGGYAIQRFGRKIKPTPTKPTAEVAREPVGIEKKPVKFIGMQERVDKPPIPLVNELDTKSTVAYDPAKHEMTNLPEYEKAVAGEKVEKAGAKKPWEMTTEERKQHRVFEYSDLQSNKPWEMTRAERKTEIKRRRDLGKERLPVRKDMIYNAYIDGTLLDEDAIKYGFAPLEKQPIPITDKSYLVKKEFRNTDFVRNIPKIAQALNAMKGQYKKPVEGLLVKIKEKIGDLIPFAGQISKGSMDWHLSHTYTGTGFEFGSPVGSQSKMQQIIDGFLKDPYKFAKDDFFQTKLEWEQFVKDEYGLDSALEMVEKGREQVEKIEYDISPEGRREKIKAVPTKPQPPKPPEAKPPKAVTEEIKGEVIPKPAIVPKELEPLAIEARKYKNAKEFEKVINKAIEESREGKTQESMISGLKIGDAKYSYEIGMALDKAGYKNITAFYNEATKKLEKPTGVEAPEEKAFATKGIVSEETLNKRAIKKYGTTNIAESIGYITREGIGIDSSGIKLGSESQGRNIDHREIAQIALGDDFSESGSEAMNRFMNETGNIRVVNIADDVNIDISIGKGIPSTQQLQQIKRLSKDKEIVYDLVDIDGNIVRSGEVATYSKFIRDLNATIEFESKLKEDVKSEKLSEKLKPLIDFIKKHNLSKKEFLDSRFNRDNPLYNEHRKAMDKTTVGVTKVWKDFGLKGNEDFYDKAIGEKPFFATKATKPQDTITQADLKSIFAKMKNISTGVDKDGNFFFRPFGKPVVTIYTVNEIEGYIDTSKGRIPVGSFLGNTIELKTGGEGHTADIGTAWHEFWHWIRKNGFASNNDIKALQGVIAKAKGISENAITEEHEAEYVGDRLSEWQGQKNLRIRRVLKKIADFVNAIYEFVSRTRTARGVLADIETGAILSEKELSTVNQFAQDVSFSLKKAAKAITDNPNFVKWFGKSVVKDKRGNPLTVYHGTDKDFTIFREGAFDVGIHLGTAEQASDRLEFKAGEDITLPKQAILPLYVRMENPLVLKTDPGLFDFANLPWALDELGKFTKKEINSLKNYESEDYRLEDELSEDQDLLFAKKELMDRFRQDVQSLLNKHGYDGIKYWNTGEIKGMAAIVRRLNAAESKTELSDIYEEKVQLEKTGGDWSYVAFEPTQIKSIYNTGAFGITESDIMFQMAGEKAIGAPTGQLVKAQEMLAEGKDKKEVWRETGWMKGAEGKWKFEIDDSGAELLQDVSRKSHGDNTKFNKLLKHNALFNAYPELSDMDVRFRSMRQEAGSLRENPDTGKFEIYLDPRKHTEAIEILLHEAQHYIQEIENFAKGGTSETFERNRFRTLDWLMKAITGYNEQLKKYSKDDKKYTVAMEGKTEAVGMYQRVRKTDTYEQYRHLAGEIEARDTAARAKLPPKQRRKQMPYKSQGIPEDQWIITEGKGTSFSVEEKTAPEIKIIGEDKTILNRISPEVSNFLKTMSAMDVYIVPRAMGKYGYVGRGMQDRPQDIHIGPKALKDDAELNATIFHETLHQIESGRWKTPAALAMKAEWESFDWKSKSPKELRRLGFGDTLWLFRKTKVKALKSGEFFAEMGEYYLERPKILKKQAKPIFDFFEKHMAKETKQFATKPTPEYKEMLKRYQEAHTTPLVDELIKKTQADFDPANATPEETKAFLKDVRKNLIPKRFRSEVLSIRDMEWYHKALETPYVLAKKFPSMKSAVKTEIKRHETRTKKMFGYYHGDLADLQKHMQKNPDDLTAFTGLLWKWEGIRFPEKDVPTNWYSVIEDVKDDDYGGIRINPEHYTEVRAYLKKQGVKDVVVDGFVAVRKILDSVLIEADATMRGNNIDQSDLKEFRSYIGKAHNYFSHIREGNSYIKITDRNTKKTVYREHFWALKERALPERKMAKARTEAWLNNQLASGKLSGKRSDYFISPAQKVTKLPDEIFFQIPVEALSQISMEAGKGLSASRVHYEAKRLMKKEGLSEKEAHDKAYNILTVDMGRILAKAMSDVLKTRGWGQHAIQRQNIPGFKKTDVFETLSGYLTGYAGFVTKIQAAKEHSKTLRDMDARKTPSAYKYTSAYVRDMLANADKTDQMVDRLRGLFFVKYLGGVVKSGIVNLTQNAVMAGPILSQYTKFSHTKLARAMKDVRKGITGKNAWMGKETDYKNLSKDEQKALTEMVETGAAQDLYLRELKGEIPGKGWGKYVRKVMDKSGIFMQIAEKFNRASTGLAAYRVAMNEGTTFEDKNTKDNHDLSVQFAKGVIYDSHFLYGKPNLPAGFRGGDFRKIARAAYTFRSFTHNYLDIMVDLMANQGTQGFKVAGRSLMNLMMVGGLTSIPFFKALSEVIKWASDDEDEDLLTGIRGTMSNKFMQDVLVYGLVGASGGFDLSGSLSIEVPRSFKEIVGVPYSIYEDSMNMVKSVKAGNMYRAVSETPFTPIVMRNAMRGIELYTKGQRTRGGKAINVPGKREPRKITGAEAIRKGILGLQPTEVSSGYKAYRAAIKMKAAIQEKKRAWADRIANATIKRDFKKVREIKQEIRDWNTLARQEGKRWRIVDITEMVEGRLIGKGLRGFPVKMRKEARRRYEVWQ